MDFHIDLPTHSHISNFIFWKVWRQFMNDNQKSIRTLNLVIVSKYCRRFTQTTPKSALTSEIIAKIQDMILEDPRLTERESVEA